MKNSEHYMYEGNKEDYNPLQYMINNENIYTFCSNTYHGSGGYVNGDNGYLVKYDRETDLHRRQKLVYLKNYVKGCLDSVITPVFSDEAYRATEDTLFREFIFNVDNKGNGIQDFTRTIIKYARLHGVCFTVMDNYEEVPDTESEAIQMRAYPYCYMMTADKVVYVDTDDYGRLEEIAFIDECEDGVQYYRLWTDEYSVVYVIEDGCKVEVGERVEHGLGILPVIATYADIDSDVMPFPPTYDLCRQNFTIYNIDSEMRNIERLSAFPMLCIQSKTDQINLDVGVDSLIVYGGEYDGGVTAPAWISPDVAILQHLQNSSDNVLNKLIESANVLGATAIQNSQAKSGIALAFEFQGQNFALKQTKRMAETFEQMVAVMFGQYTNRSIDYIVIYRDNYKPTQQEVDAKLTTYERLLDMNISPEFNAEIQKQLVKDVVDYYKWDSNVDTLIQSVATANSLL
jgi:hypothetical protein